MQKPKNYFLLALTILALGASQAKADKLDSDGVIRDDDGNVRTMIWFDAMGIDYQTKKKVGPDVCEQFSARLPTIRELADWSKARGAKGVLKTEGPNPAQAVEHFGTWYYGYEGINPNGKQDKIFYSEEGYQSLPEESAGVWYWSSTLTELNFPIVDIGITMHGRTGEIYEGQSLYNSGNGVICVRD